MNKKTLWYLLGGLALVSFYFIFRGTGSTAETEILTAVKKGTLAIEIATTGELEAKNSVKIMGPGNIRSVGIWQMKIESLVEEGKLVKKGEFVASLDKSEIMGKMQNLQTELDKIQSQYLQTELDTTLQMRQSRDELVNLKYTTEEKKLILEQSRFEPPATIKQAEIELSKADRNFEQAQQNYKIKAEQNKAKMQEVAATLTKARRELENLMDLISQFEITAPEDGMVIYQRDWDGSRITTGSQIGAWDPTVASLPDLTSMISKTYVNEVDIRKIQVGQLVKVGLDAFPEKKLTGKVIRVANVGEQKPNSDAKVFEVVIEINETDTSLRPAMTTSNTIIAEVLENVAFVPLECLHSQGDSITYVYRKDGLNVIKQQIMVGKTNSNEAVILSGASEGDQLFMSTPSGYEASKVQLLEPTKETAKL